MLVPNRHADSPAYRYGFNGMEKDDELKGDGNSYDFGARMLDPRIGRFFALDPLQGKYPYLSAYLFAYNNPICFIDQNGLSGELPNKIGTTKAVVTNLSDEQLKEYIKNLNIVKDKVFNQPYLSDKFVLALLKEEKLSLSMYDVDQNNLNTAKARGGNATIGFGHLVHYGAIGSNQYDKGALDKEKDFLKDITIEKAFDLFSEDLNSRLEMLNRQLKYRKLDYDYTKLEAGVRDLFIDYIYNTGSAGNAINIYKKSGVIGLYEAIKNGHKDLPNISEARKNMRLELLQDDYDYAVQMEKAREKKTRDKKRGDQLANFKSGRPEK